MTEFLQHLDYTIWSPCSKQVNVVSNTMVYHHVQGTYMLERNEAAQRLGVPEKMGMVSAARSGHVRHEVAAAR
jgi:hypothetical protein